MTNERQVSKNVLMAVVQVVVTGGSIFLLYRFVIEYIGMAAFGVWALVLAVTNASSIANLGLAASAVKFVSQHLALDDRDRAAQIVQTSVLFVAVFLGLVVVALFPVFKQVLAFVVEPSDQLPAALSVLPYAMASFCMASTSAVLLSCVDGYHRVDMRSLLLTAGAILYLVLALLMVPDGGLIGLARAQVLHAAILVAGSWIVLKRLEPRLPWFPYRWSRDVFREIIGYSLQFQVVSFTRLLLEPVTKSLISKFGGMATVGFFEFAYRMVVQLRAVVVTAHAALVPTIADIHVRAPEQLRRLYQRSFALLSYIISIGLPLLLALTPVVSRLWIGRYEPAFVLFSILVFVGWFSNIFSGPAYFANMGTGDLRWNVYGHIVTGVVNAGLGILLGLYFGATGVVVAFMVGVMLGSGIVVVQYQRKHRIAVSSLLDKPAIWLGVFSLAGMALACVVYALFAESWHVLALTTAMIGVYAAVVVSPAWHHPMRKEIGQWLRGLTSRTETQRTET